MFEDFFRFLDRFPSEFWVATLFGMIVIFFFAYHEFDKPTFERAETDPVTFFKPRELTTGRQFLLSFVMYCLALELIYVLAVFIGPQPFIDAQLQAGPAESPQSPPETPASIPLSIALVMTGLLPRVPLLNSLELGIRRFMHERASIPSAAVELADNLRGAPLRPNLAGRYLASLPRHLRETLDQDAAADDDLLYSSWVRLWILLSRLSDVPNDPDATGFGFRSFLRSHRFQVGSVETAAHKLVPLVQQLKSLERSLDGLEASDRNEVETQIDNLDRQVRPQVDTLLESVHILCACMMIASPKGAEEAGKARDVLGFGGESRTVRSLDMEYATRAVLSAGAAGLLLIFLAPMFGGLIPGSLRNGWPNNPVHALPWLFSALLTHGSAVCIALGVRGYFQRRSRWLSRGAESYHRVALRYSLASVLAYIGAFLVLFYWVWAQTKEGEIQHLYSMALATSAAAASGAFVCYWLDSQYTKRLLTPSATLDGALQAVVTGLLASFGAIALESELMGEGFPPAPGSVLFAAVFAMIIGFIIGCVLSSYVRKRIGNTTSALMHS